MTPTKQQAIAFFYAAIGWEPVGTDMDGEDVARPQSPVLRAHLGGALPAGVPCIYNVEHSIKADRRVVLVDYEQEAIRQLKAYLHAMADALPDFEKNGGVK